MAIAAIDWANGPAVVTPLREAMIEATRDCEPFELDDIFAALPPVPTEIADVAETALDEAHDAAIAATPILRTFARAKPIRLLTGLAAFSFEAGGAGDGEWAHGAELSDALLDAFRWPNGKNLRVDALFKRDFKRNFMMWPNDGLVARLREDFPEITEDGIADMLKGVA